MTADKSAEMDYAAAAALPRVKICLCATASEDGTRVAMATRAGRHTLGGCKLNPLEPEEIGMFKSPAGVLRAGCVPVQDSLTLWLHAPFASLAKSQKVFPSLLDIALPFPLEKCLYQFLDIRKMPDKTHCALAVAIRRERMESLIQRYQSEGIDPEIMDHEGVAVWTQSIREEPVLPETIRVILYMAEKHLTVVIGKDNRFSDAHSLKLDTGENRTESAAIRIKRYLCPDVQPGATIQWAFCGVGAEDKVLVDSLHEKLSHDWPGPCMRHQEPGLFLMRAIGSRSLYREPLPCNLRCGNLAHPHIPRTARRLGIFGVVLMLSAGLLLCCANLAWHIMSNRRFEKAKHTVTALVEHIAPGERIPYGMESAGLKQIITKRQSLFTPFIQAFKPSLAESLDTLVRKGKNLNLDFEKLVLRREHVTILGTAEDWDKCEIFLKNIRAMGYSANLERHDAGADGLIRFVLESEPIGDKRHK